ncbi:MAG TPA: hypothetical protein VJN95_14830 [Gemmatimonadales bacterium]|nr:hypothetical protein [Gemmatimonadales bacterium]
MVRLGWPGWLIGLLLITGRAAAQDPAPALRVELGENIPNPFFPATSIPFVIHPEVCTRGHDPLVSLKIYNVLAQVIAIPVLQGQPNEVLDQIRLKCGSYVAVWDGKLLDGRSEVTPGIYYYQLMVDGQRFTRKMIARR